MPSLVRPPRLALRPFVKTLWAVDSEPSLLSTPAHFEHVLPTGLMHLVFRLSPSVLQIYDDASRLQGRTLGNALVGGPRSRFYARGVTHPSRSVGVQLRPGAAWALFGVSAFELAERHTPLDELWGSAAAQIHEALLNSPSAESAVECLEAALAARLSGAPLLHPAVAHALLVLAAAPVPVAHLVATSGLSHRVFIERFRATVGLTPKMFSRIQRFQQARAALTEPTSSLAGVAGLAGYADQAHFTREFKQLAGVPPLRVRNAGGSNHVVIRPPG